MAAAQKRINVSLDSSCCIYIYNIDMYTYTLINGNCAFISALHTVVFLANWEKKRSVNTQTQMLKIAKKNKNIVSVQMENKY